MPDDDILYNPIVPHMCYSYSGIYYLVDIETGEIRYQGEEEKGILQERHDRPKISKQLNLFI